MIRLHIAGSAVVCASLFQPALAHEDADTETFASDHAPIGVMADHRHEKGEWMLSYRYMHMDMSGNRIGTDSVAPDTIATETPNRFAGRPGQPPTLRVVPTDMTMGMNMFGAMYGLTERVTLMAMGMHVTKEMDHITFAGGMGTDRLGEFTTESAGFGDTVLTALIGLDDGQRDHGGLTGSLGVSLPTGSLEETDAILTPMGATPSPRLPYAMQLGSGTFDLKPGITATERLGDWSLGGQVMGTVRLGENSEDYTLGDGVEATAWIAREPAPWISLSARLKVSSFGDIEGIDPAIVAPVQTADPGNYGGDTLEVLFGANLAGQSGWIEGQRLAVEIGLPVHRDLNGPQLETDLTLTLGWQKAF